MKRVKNEKVTNKNEEDREKYKEDSKEVIKICKKKKME